MSLCRVLQRISTSSPAAAPVAVRELLHWQLPASASLPPLSLSAPSPQQQVPKPLPRCTTTASQPTPQQAASAPPQRVAAAARPATPLSASSAKPAPTAARLGNIVAQGPQPAAHALSGEKHSARRKLHAPGGALSNGSLSSALGVGLPASSHLQPATPAQPQSALPLQQKLSPRRAAFAAAAVTSAGATAGPVAVAADGQRPVAAAQPPVTGSMAGTALQQAAEPQQPSRSNERRPSTAKPAQVWSRSISYATTLHRPCSGMWNAWAALLDRQSADGMCYSQDPPREQAEHSAAGISARNRNLQTSSGALQQQGTRTTPGVAVKKICRSCCRHQTSSEPLAFLATAFDT